MQPLKHRETGARSKVTDPRLQQAKGLGLELKNLLKTRDPWDRQVEFQRDATRKAYLRVIFSSPALTSSSLALLSSSTRSSSNLSPSLNHHNSTSLEALNLVWLETSHSLITIYRSKLAKMDKQIQENPKPPSRTKNVDKRGGNDGNVQYAQPPPSTANSNSSSVVGPVARRKFVQQFEKFLNQEQTFWNIVSNRLASRLLPEEQVELRPLGIVASKYDDTKESSQEVDEEVSEEETKRRRLEVLPLIHKTLICFGDLARYVEYHSDTPAPTPAAAAGGRGNGRRGGKRNGGSAARSAIPVKTYSKAAECYRQANLLLPDDGNSHNQLAVLSQYAQDPLSSTYHYYRALTVRIPFSTASKNLSIAYTKILSRYDFAGENRRARIGDGEDDELEGTEQAQRFSEAFMALHGIFFTKTKLTELDSAMTRVNDSFELCTRERLITSDGVLKIVVTSLAALWHARLTRSRSLADHSTLALSRSKSTSLAPESANTAQATTNDPATTSEPKLEAHILIHTLQLYTILLSISSIETNELYSTNLSNDPSSSSSSVDSNISAVLRRSVPALRILGKWLIGQIDYIERLEKRVQEKEKKRVRRKTRTSEGSSLEEAQKSLDSSGGAQPGGTGGSNDSTLGVVSSELLERTLDCFWTAFADYSNSIKLAFPREALPKLELDAWMEEDVECLGFSPLRRRTVPGTGGGASSAKEGARRVGRDVHPNQEVLMRIEEAQRLAEEIAEAPFSRIALVDGAYIFAAPGEQYLEEEEAAEDVNLEVDEKARNGDAELDGPGVPLEEDSEMRDQSTEDDPVDRAMRTAADQLELDGVDEDEMDSENEDEDEQIVFSGSRNPSQQPIPRPAPVQSSAPPGFPPRNPNTSSSLTAADLRQQLFAPSPPIQPPLSNTTPTRPTSQPPSTANYASPSLLIPSQVPSTPNAISSIWGAPPPGPPSHLRHPSSNLSGPSLLPQHQQQQQHHQPMTPHSFEAIPNLTHNALAAHQLGWSSVSPHNSSPHHLPPPPHSSAQPTAIPPAQLFGGHPAFSIPPPPQPPQVQPHPHAQSHSQPPPFNIDTNHSLENGFSRAFSLPPAPPPPSNATPLPSHYHSPQHHPQYSPGLSTAHVGLSPSGFPLSNGPRLGGFALPTPTKDPTGGGGGWPTNLRGT